MTNLDAIFGRNLVFYRKARGYHSADVFAEALEISHRALQRYEGGKRLPASDLIEKMASKLGVNASDFFRVDPVSEGHAVPIEGMPVSIFAKKLLNIPDEVYEMAAKFGPDHEVWQAVLGALDAAEESDKKKLMKTQQAKVKA